MPEETVTPSMTKEDKAVAGKVIRARIAWVLLFLRKKVKIKRNITSHAVDPYIHQNTFAKLVSKVALSEYDRSNTPDVTPAIGDISSPLVVEYIPHAVYQLELMTKSNLTVEALADLAYIPNTAYKRLLKQIALEYLNDVTSASISKLIPEQPQQLLPAAG